MKMIRWTGEQEICVATCMPIEHRAQVASVGSGDGSSRRTDCHRK